MPEPKAGKYYKHYNGGIYRVVEVIDYNVYMIRDGAMYTIGLDLWHAPVISDNNMLADRFREVTRHG